MALLNIHVQLEGEADDSFKYTPYMGRISYGLPQTVPIRILPWVKITRSSLESLARKYGLNADDTFSLARLFLVPRYLKGMLDTFPRQSNPSQEERNAQLISNIRLVLSLFFPAGAPLYYKSRIYSVNRMEWDGDVKARYPGRPKSNTIISSKRGGAPTSTTSTSTAATPKRTVSPKTRTSVSKKSVTVKSTPKSALKKSSQPVVESVPAVYDISITLFVTRGRRPATFTRKLRASCKTKRAKLRKTILDVLGPRFDIGAPKDTSHLRRQEAPTMHSTPGDLLRKTWSARPINYRYSSSYPTSTMYPTGSVYPTGGVYPSGGVYPTGGVYPSGTLSHPIASLSDRGHTYIMGQQDPRTFHPGSHAALWGYPHYPMTGTPIYGPPATK